MDRYTTSGGKDSCRKRFWGDFFILCLIVGAALAVRLYGAGSLRPFHNDEGVNYYFLRQISLKGYYPYSHRNYHGPLFFYLSWFISYVFGYSEVALRSISILAGTILTVVPWFVLSAYKKGLRYAGVLVVSFSPSLVFYSRYFIHEMLFLLISSLLARFLIVAFKNSKHGYLFLSLVLAGLLVSIKETFVITLFSLFLAAIFAFGFREIIEEISKAKEAILAGLLAAITAIFLIFSGGFRWFGGVREIFLALPQWFHRGYGDIGHFKPFYYYFVLLLKTEPHLILSLFLSSLFIVLRLIKKFHNRWLLDLAKDPLLSFVTVWGVCQFLIYSAVSYKTPWLVINITFPLILGLIGFLEHLFRLRYGAVRIPTTISIAFLWAVSLLSCYRYNFSLPYGPKNPFSYTHTSSGMIRLVKDINLYNAQYPNSKVLIGVKQYWPLPYYLRDYKGGQGYFIPKLPHTYCGEYNIIILDKGTFLACEGWERRYYRLSDVQESYTYFKVATTE